MSVYTQEVLGLLKRNKKKIKLDKIRDHFEFGKLYRNSTLNTGAVYNPTMEPFVIKWGDFKCATEEGMVRQDPTGTEERHITMWTDPVFQGECQTATITKTIISQNIAGNEINIAGDLDVDNNLNVDGNAVIDLQLTAGSANILDLTEDRIVIVGPNGELEDDGNFTFDGAFFNIGQGNFTVQVSTGNTQIVGTLDVDSQATLASANVEDLTEDRIVIVGPNGELEDDANFTMDGTTFTANVNVVHGTDVPGGTPAETTTINSNLKLEGPVYDSLGNIGSLNKVLVGLADGRVKWQDDDVVEALTYGALWQGDPTNYKVELPIGTAGQILISDGTTFSWQDDPYVDGSGTLYRLPLWTPDGDSLGDSLLIQDGDKDTPATQVQNDGILKNVGIVKLDSVAQDDTLTQVLVRDPGSANEVKFRDAASIKPAVGFDTLDMAPDGWASPDGNFNAYIRLDDGSEGAIIKNVKDMNWLVDGDRVLVIAENVKTGSFLQDNILRFPTWGSSGNEVSNQTSWNQASIGSGWTGAVDNGYETSTLKYGEKLKIRGEMYHIPGGTLRQMNWDACCKVYSNNQCPVASPLSFTINEDEGLANTVNVSDDGYGGYGLTYTVVQQPNDTKTFTFDAATGAFTLQPNNNFFGTITFTYQANDGYCDSNVATVTVTVNAVDDAPVWTSTDPVTANTYPNLTGGDTWTYNWTVADVDTPCGNLTFPSQTIPSWLTFTNNGDCTGTLTGTLPATGGNFPVQLNVSDGTSTASQSFTIGGLAVTKDTYFVFWSDTSGSMGTTIQVMSQMVSAAEVKVFLGPNGQSGTNINLNPLVNNSIVNNESKKINTSSGKASSAFLCITNGMEVSGTGVPAGTTVQSGGGGSNIVLSNSITASTNQVLTFTTTQAQKDTDYADSTNLRNLLQDFYATGGTKGSGNTDTATNGQDMYDSHIYWGHMVEERQIQYLSNAGEGFTIGSSGYFPDAENIVILGFADESSSYSIDQTGPNSWADRQNTTVADIVSDIQDVQTYINNIETAAGNNSIYRAIFYNVQETGTNGASLEPILGETGLCATGGRAVNGFTYAPDATAYNINTQTLYPQSSGAPTRIAYRDNMTNGSTASFYYNQVRAGLNSIGFSL
jgi:hypothetical protein|tara:strand:- start:2084 stop:5452 length:3369 start_codon:yes stop_codon:yes gene_type:complete